MVSFCGCVSSSQVRRSTYVNLFALLGSAVAEAQYLAIVRNALLVREEELKPRVSLGLVAPSMHAGRREEGGGFESYDAVMGHCPQPMRIFCTRRRGKDGLTLSKG